MAQDPNAWLWAPQFDQNTQMSTYNPATGQWDNQQPWMTDPLAINGQLRTQITDYLRAAGYTGQLQDGAAYRAYQAANTPGGASGLAGYGVGGREAAMNREAAQISGWTPDASVWNPRTQNTELDQWLQQQGLRLQIGDHQVPGASQSTSIQRLIDAQGNPVAVDAYNNRYSAGDRAMDVGMAALVALSAGAGMGLLGSGSGAAAGAGAGAATTGAATTGAGAAGAGAAGLSTASLPGSITAGLGLSNAAPIALAPSIIGPGAATAASAAAAAAAAGGGGITAGLGSASELLGGLSSNSALFNPVAMAPGSAGLGGAAAAGLTGNALADAAMQASIDAGSFAGAGGGLGQAGIGGFGSSLANMGALEGAAMLTGGGSLLTTPGLGGAGSALSGLGSIKDVIDSVKNSGVGKAVGTVADMVGGGNNLAAIVGGLAGATQGGGEDTATTQNRIDPRMAQYLYGTGYGDTNSLLGASQEWWKNNKSGMNDDMAAGLLTLKNLYTSPEYTQGYQQMRSAGQGLLGAGVAQNPFTSGQMPQFGRAAPQIAAAAQSPFLAGLLGAAPQMPNRFGG